MKVLIINGSPRVDGNTTIAVNELKNTFIAEGVDGLFCYDPIIAPRTLSNNSKTA